MADKFLMVDDAQQVVAVKKVAPGDIPQLQIDSTLTQHGVAADSKTVGDTFASLRPNFEAQYSNTGRYKVGDYVMHGNVLKRCVTAIDADEEWTETHWEDAAIAADFAENKAVTDKAISMAKSRIASETIPLIIKREKITDAVKVTSYFRNNYLNSAFLPAIFYDSARNKLCVVICGSFDPTLEVYKNVTTLLVARMWSQDPDFDRELTLEDAGDVRSSMDSIKSLNGYLGYFNWKKKDAFASDGAVLTIRFAVGLYRDVQDISHYEDYFYTPQYRITLNNGEISYTVTDYPRATKASYVFDVASFRTSGVRGVLLNPQYEPTAVTDQFKPIFYMTTAEYTAAVATDESAVVQGWNFPFTTVFPDSGFSNDKIFAYGFRDSVQRKWNIVDVV